MGIYGFIKKQKEARRSYRQAKDNLESKRLKAKADYYAERDKKSKEIASSKASIREAKQNLRKRTPAYRVVNALKDKVKENKKSGKGLLGGQGFASRFDNGGSSGVSFLDRYDNKPKAKKKSKRKSIVINL